MWRGAERRFKTEHLNGLCFEADGGGLPPLKYGDARLFGVDDVWSKEIPRRGSRPDFRET